MTRQRIRLTARGELVFGSLAGAAIVLTFIVGCAVVGDFLGI